MKQRDRNFDIFNLSFLDVISCGFGAIVLLVLISKPLPEPSPEQTFDAKELLGQVFKAETTVDTMTRQLAEARESWESKATLLKTLRKTLETSTTKVPNKSVYVRWLRQPS